MNGELVGYFGSAKDLRQDCSLSPYLFVVCMNVLSNKLDKAATDEKICFRPQCKYLQRTHLCFVDNLSFLLTGISSL